MSGILVGELILWLIIALVVIVVVVYVVNWLYHRSSKEVSFVRTGFLGEQVVINGGAFVLPFIHDFTPVNMNVLPMPITRSKQDAVITRDRMRIDIEADFYVRVRPTREAVSIAAATLGRRTLEPERLHALLSGKFVSAMRSVASEMTMEQMHEKRGEYVSRVKEAAAEALAQNGLELESVAITDLDQTDLEFFNPSNRFDAEGLTRLMEDIEAKRKLRNDIEQDSMIKIRTRNLEAERQALDIERQSETARLDQERDIEVSRAVQRTEVARERALRETEAEQAQISRDHRKGADIQRTGHHRSPHRLRARYPAKGNRTQPRGRGSRNSRARIHRKGPHPAGPRRHRRPHRQRGGDPPARDRTHAVGRRGRDISQGNHREGAHCADHCRQR
jgi:uncharacterized membrane protein YqiK